MAEKKKLFDEKGKLFGKINIIDLVVLALIIAVVVIIGMKLTGRGPTTPQAQEGTELEYTVIVYRISPTVYAEVEKEVALGGDHAGLMANGEMLAGSYVKSVTSQPHVESVPVDDGTLVRSEEPDLVDAIFTIRAMVTNPVTQAVGTQEVRIGKSHIVKTKTLELGNGVILTCAPVEGG